MRNIPVRFILKALLNRCISQPSKMLGLCSIANENSVGEQMKYNNIQQTYKDKHVFFFSQSPGPSPMESVRGHWKATVNSERRGEWRILNRKKRTAKCVLIHFIEINANSNVAPGGDEIARVDDFDMPEHHMMLGHVKIVNPCYFIATRGKFQCRCSYLYS